MARSTDLDITVLNDLVETTLDSARGYDQAGHDAMRALDHAPKRVA